MGAVTTMAAQRTLQQHCDCRAACQGRTTPCLTCTHPDAEPWPSATDSCTLGEWATGPLLLAVPVGIVLGIAYGLVRHFFPGIFP